MAPSLATSLTFLFVAWLFYSASRRDSAFLRELWIPTIWVGIYASRMVGTWIGGDTSALDGSPLDRNLLFALILLGLLVLIRRHPDWNSLFRRNVWLFLYLAFCAITTLWADYTFVAFKRWIKEFGTLVMVLIIVTEPDPIYAARKVFLRCAYVLVPVSILLIKYYLEIGRTYDEWTGEAMFCGVTNDKNALGRLSFVSALFLLSSVVETRGPEGWWQRVKRGFPDITVLAMCAWLLLNADSSTAKGCFGVGLIIFLVTRLNAVRQRPRLLAIGTLVLIVGSFLVLLTPDIRTTVAGSMGRRGDLTDRTKIWEGCFALGTDPIIGCGYGSVWLTSGGRRLQRELKMAHSHNGYLETYLNTGLVGLLLLVGALTVAGRNALREVTEEAEGGSLLIALFVSCTIYNYAEVGFGNISIISVVMWMLAVWTGSPSVESQMSWNETEATTDDETALRPEPTVPMWMSSSPIARDVARCVQLGK